MFTCVSRLVAPRPISLSDSMPADALTFLVASTKGSLRPVGWNWPPSPPGRTWGSHVTCLFSFRRDRWMCCVRIPAPSVAGMLCSFAYFFTLKRGRNCVIFVRNFIPTSARPLVKWKEETSLALHILCLRVNAHDNEQLGNNVVFWDFVGCCICRVFFGGGAQGPIALLTKCVSRMLGSSLLYCSAFRRTPHHFGARLLLSDWFEMHNSIYTPPADHKKSMAHWPWRRNSRRKGRNLDFSIVLSFIMGLLIDS